MGETWYVCTWVEKEITKDSYESGCETFRESVFFERCNHKARSFSGLLAVLREAYGLAIDDLFIPEDPDEENFLCEQVSYFGYNREENDEGDYPSESEWMEFEAGERKLWLADYTFHVEVRQTRPLSLDEIKEAGISTH